jgi:hydrogenase-4 component J
MAGERAVFYQLTHKFVNSEQDIPEDARQLVYYSLAVGHHVGMLDCFQSLMEIPLEDYRRWVACLADGSGHRKLEGILKWGEIEINRSHAKELVETLRDSLPSMDSRQSAWAITLSQYLQEMITEPALYLMVRKRA